MRTPHLLRWLAERGASHLVLVGPVADADPPGPDVTVTAVDDLDGLPEALDRLAATGSEIRTVLHVADSDGAGDPVGVLDPHDLADAVAARTTAVELLGRACAGLPIDEFVVFTSTAAVWGSGERRSPPPWAPGWRRWPRAGVPPAARPPSSHGCPGGTRSPMRRSCAAGGPAAARRRGPVRAGAGPGPRRRPTGRGRPRLARVRAGLHRRTAQRAAARRARGDGRCRAGGR
ncbi:KR domain-containing protein [Micromonospora sp. BRA006-A]|nr:KR domain-containing protein [Micromonospora sp. BRA006-A]